MEQKQEEIAIAVDHISKVYKLYDKPMDRMVEALGLTKRRNIGNILLFPMFLFR